MLGRNDIIRIVQGVAHEMRETSLLQDDLMDKKQCADFLHLTPDGVQTRVRTRQIPYHKHGNKLYFSRREVYNYYLNETNLVEPIS